MSSSTYSRQGRGFLTEHYTVFGFCVYRRVTDQHWSPQYVERRVELGIRIGRWRFGWSQQFAYDNEGKMIMEGTWH